MSSFQPRTARWLPGLVLASVFLAPLLTAQDPQQPATQQPTSPQGQNQGQGQGRGFAGGRGMGGMFGPGSGGAAGTVTAISGNEITVKNEQGEVYKVETGPNTRFRKDREEAKISDIHVGDVVMAAGNLDDQAKTVGAMFVAVLDPQQAARMEKMRADFGKTWTMGRMTAIKDLTVTVERPDKISQTIAVDENTIFHKRGPDGNEDITFPDIKVGDMVRATGAVQNGNFQATDLTVVPPGGHGPGRYGQGERQNPPPPAGGSPAQPPATPRN